MRRPLALLAVVLLSCGPAATGYVERATQVRFETTSDDFWALPLPSQFRMKADGSLDLERFPGKRTALANMWIQAAQKRVRGGWATTGGIFFTTTGAVDPSTLTESSAYLVDIDDASPEVGRHFPLTYEFTPNAGTLNPPNMLALLPPLGFVRRPLTTYAAVLTDAVKDTSGQPLGRSKTFDTTFGSDPSFEVLKTYLKGKSLDASHVIAATVFKTIDPADHLKKLVKWEESLPAPAVTAPYVAAETYPGFQVVVGQYTVPKIQSGERPGDG